jgi:hypothetical protein
MMGNNERVYVDIEEEAAMYHQFKARDKHISVS